MEASEAWWEVGVWKVSSESLAFFFEDDDLAFEAEDLELHLVMHDVLEVSVDCC